MSRQAASVATLCFKVGSRAMTVTAINRQTNPTTEMTVRTVCACSHGSQICSQFCGGAEICQVISSLLIGTLTMRVKTNTAAMHRVPIAVKMKFLVL